MTLRVALPCKCQQDTAMGQKRGDKLCVHGNLFEKPGTGSQRPRRRSSIKQGKGFAASTAQRDHVKGKPCVGCGHAFDWEETGAEQQVDPAHLWKRGLGGCAHPLCVIPLCRTCHRLFDAEELDLHGKLVDRGYFKEMAHAIEAHKVSPLTLIQRLTGTEWQAVSRGALTPGA